jgi:hypothetical protein
MTIRLKDDRHKKGKKIVLKTYSKREERAPKTIDFIWLVRHCRLRPKFLRDAIKVLEKEYPSIDFYQEFDWWQEGCPRIREEGDHESEFWAYISEKGFPPKGDMIAKQEMDAMERKQMEHEAIRDLNKPCGAVKILHLIYKKDPKKKWVTNKDKNWLRDLLLGKEGISKVYDILDNRCGNGENKELARSYLRDSFRLAEEKNIEKLTKNKEEVIIRSEKGWITHINKMPLRVRMRSADLADTNFFDKYEAITRLGHPDGKGTVSYYKKIPLAQRGRKPEKKRKFELDEQETFIVRPRTMKIKPVQKKDISEYTHEIEKLNSLLKHPDETKRITEKEYANRVSELDKEYPQIKMMQVRRALGEEEIPKPPKEEKRKRLKGAKGEFISTGGGQRTLFGSAPEKKELDEYIRKLRRRR